MINVKISDPLELEQYQPIAKYQNYKVISGASLPHPCIKAVFYSVQAKINISQAGFSSISNLKKYHSDYFYRWMQVHPYIIYLWFGKLIKSKLKTTKKI